MKRIWPGEEKQAKNRGLPEKNFFARRVDNYNHVFDS
jgi:hypothetical protein